MFAMSVVLFITVEFLGIYYLLRGLGFSKYLVAQLMGSIGWVQRGKVTKARRPKKKFQNREFLFGLAMIIGGWILLLWSIGIYNASLLG